MCIKKIQSLAFIILLCFLFCSCYDGDPYEGQRPIDYPNSYWVCKEPNAFFLVGENQEIIDAKITIDNQIVPLKFIWSGVDNHVSLNFDVDSQAYGNSGSCNFGRDKFTIKIEYKDNIGEGPIMVFERRTMDEYLADHG